MARNNVLRVDDHFDNLFSMRCFSYKACPEPAACSSCGAGDGHGDVTDKADLDLHIQPNVKYEDGTVVTSRTSSTRSSASTTGR